MAFRGGVYERRVLELWSSIVSSRTEPQIAKCCPPPPVPRNSRSAFKEKWEASEEVSTDN